MDQLRDAGTRKSCDLLTYLYCVTLLMSCILMINFFCFLRCISCDDRVAAAEVPSGQLYSVGAREAALVGLRLRASSGNRTF